MNMVARLDNKYDLYCTWSTHKFEAILIFIEKLTVIIAIEIIVYDFFEESLENTICRISPYYSQPTAHTAAIQVHIAKTSINLFLSHFLIDSIRIFCLFQMLQTTWKSNRLYTLC